MGCRNQSISTYHILLTALLLLAALPAQANNLAPNCSGAIAVPDRIWPSNHQFRSIGIDGVSDADGDDVTVAIRCIMQDEPLNANGDGNTDIDGKGLGASVAQVRSERAGPRNGRVYHIDFIATDARGAACAGSVQVGVSHNKKPPAVDDGRLYQSTAEPGECSNQPINNPPVVTSTPVRSAEQSIPYAYQVEAFDPDTDPLTYSLPDAPSGMSIAASEGAITWTPAADHVGEQTVTVQVSDGNGGTATQNFTITVQPPPNQPPAVEDISVQTQEDAGVAIDLQASDPDGDALSYTIVDPPANGSLTGDAPGLVYRPAAQFNGTDSFTYRVNDGIADSATATVTIVVNPVNDAPVVENVSLATPEDQATVVELTGTDIENDELTYRLVAPPESGAVEISGSTATYTPDTDFNGNVSFSYAANDGAIDSSPATVTVTVEPVNDPPVAESQSVAVAEDGFVDIVLQGNDVDGDNLDFTVVQEPANGVLSGSAPDIRYTPDADFNGRDQFSFTVADGEFTSAEADVIVDVSAVNDAPDARGQNVTVNEDGVVDIRLTGTDVDGDSLDFVITQDPASGSLLGSPPDIRYSPAPDFNGQDQFGFAVDDGELSSAEATVTVDVAPVNDPPVVDIIEPAGILIFEDNEAIQFTATADDVEDGNLDARIQWSALPGFEDLGSGGSISATLSAGSYMVTADVVDDQGLQSTDSINIEVNVFNSPPEITSTPVTTVEEGGTYNYQVDAVDAESSELNYSLSTAPAGMSIDPDTGVIGWTADTALAGSVTDENVQCRTPASTLETVDKAADAVVVVDVSRSMSADVPWISGAISRIDARLKARGVGTGDLSNRYGLVRFGNSAETVPVGGGLFGSVGDFVASSFDLTADNQLGFIEDGLLATQFTLENYAFRENAARHIILITDEAHTSQDPDITLESVSAALRERGVTLNSIISLTDGAGGIDGVVCDPSGDFGFGIAADRRGYLRQGGEYRLCEGARLQDDLDSTRYPPLALESGGAVWDLRVLRQGGESTRAFSKAFIDVNVDKLIENLPGRLQPDLIVRDIETDPAAEQVVVTVLNRGLTASAEGLLSLYDDRGELLGETPLAALAGNESADIVFQTNVAGVAGIRADISAAGGSDAAECNAGNNALTTPTVTVQVEDGGGATAEQTYLVDVTDVNMSPAIVSQPDTQPIFAGLTYTYQVEIDDPDRGDSHSYRLLKSSPNGSINELTGEFTMTPGPGDVGQQEMTVVVSDLAGNEDSQTFVLTIENSADGGYRLPRFEPLTRVQHAVVGQTYTFTPQVTADPAADLDFELLTGPDGMTVDPSDGSVNWPVPPGDIGRIEPVALLLRDQFGNADTLSFEAFKDEPNTAPRFAEPPPYDTRAVAESPQSNYGYKFRFTDSNVRENLSVSLDAAPPGMTMATEQPAEVLLGEFLGKFTPGSATLSWPRQSITANTTYSERIRRTDFMCRASGNAGGAVAKQPLWERSVDTEMVQAAPLTDSNDDGVVNEQDSTAVVLTRRRSGSSNTLYAVDGPSGDVLWSNRDYEPSRFYTPAIADLDADKAPEILLVEENLRLIAVRPGDRSLVWRSNAPIRNNRAFYAQVNVVDLDGDGDPEILAGPSVFNHNGRLLWSFDHTGPDRHGVPLAVDLNLDGVQELVYADQVRDAQGNLLNRIDVFDDRDVDYYHAVPVNIDADDNPELVLTAADSFRGENAGVAMVNHGGSLVWGPVDLPSSGQPLVGDFNGDGATEIFVPGAERLLAADTGELLWQADNTAVFTAAGRATAVDFHNDGLVEIVVSRRDGTTIYDGNTGARVNRWPMDGWRGGPFRPPLVVDLNGDGDAEVVATSEDGIRGFDVGSETLVPGRRPQGSLAEAWLNADLTVKQNPEAVWLTHNSAGVVAPSGNRFTDGIPDLRVSAATGDYSSATVEVVNRGTADYNSPFSVQLFAGDPASGGTLLAGREVQPLAAGQAVELMFAGAVPAGSNTEVVAHIESASPVPECRANNNNASSWPVMYTVTDHGGLTASQDYLLPTVQYREIEPSTEPAQRVTEETLLQHQVSVEQPDDNNRVFFDILDAPRGVTVDPVTGVVSWIPERGQAGSYRITVRVRSLGRDRLTGFTVTVDPAPNAAPEITSQPPAQPPAVGSLYRYDVEASDVDGDTLTFSLLQNPAGMNIDASTGVIEWTPTADQLGTRQFQVQVSDGNGGTAEQTVTVEVGEANNPPEITSTPPQQALFVGDAFIYDVEADDPDGDTLTFTLETAPAGMSIDPVTGMVVWVPEADQVGSHDIAIHAADDRGATAFQNITLTVNAPLNQGPVINSEPPTDVVEGTPYFYDVQADDPDGDALNYALTTAPDGMTIDAVSGVIEWTPTGAQLGSQSVALEVRDGNGGFATQAFSVFVTAESDNVPPQIDSTPVDLTGVGQAYQYQVTATDPDSSNLTYSLPSAPDGMSVDPQSGRVTWLSEASDIGDHNVTVRVEDGVGFARQQYTLTVLDVTAPLDAVIDVDPPVIGPGESTTVSVVVAGGLPPYTASLTVNGESVPLDAARQATITAQNTGRFDLRATAGDAEETVTVESHFTVRDPDDTTAPAVSISAPAADQVVTAPVDIVGSVQDDNLSEYRLLVSPRGEDRFTEIATATAPVAAGVLGRFDPSLLMNGQYELVLEALDYNGQRSTASVIVQVDGELKVGNFSFTVEDLNIPVSGIPIRVTRTYDTRRKSEDLDFGYGWSVNYQDVRIDESRRIGEGWELVRIDSGPLGAFTQWCIRPLGAPEVTVALPTGRVERFEARVTPECKQFFPTLDVQVEFEPVGETTLSTLEVSEPQTVRLGNENLVIIDSGGAVYDPDRYILTTREGYVYELDQDFGIRTVRDPNGNTLTYTDDGIFHSDGKSVLFNRDADGRITAITDPAGNRHRYVYDAAGNLRRAIDPLDNATDYTYNRRHGLLEIIDPLGRPLVKNIYDADGRLIAQEDENGERTEFNHDLDGRMSVVTDRLGRVTQLFYDDDGQVTERLDALNNLTAFTYDAAGNQLTETNPLNQTRRATYDDRRNQLTQSDPLNNTVRFEYNDLGQEVRVVDARDNVFLNSYDAFGNLLDVTDPLDNVALNHIDAKGHVSLTRDAEGNETTFTYDGEGNKLTETDPLGHTTEYTYDANGNRLSETRTRTVGGTPVTETTSFEYDARDRRVKTVYPDGTSTRTEYDAAGNEAATVDRLERRTEYDYDVYGRLVETRYPDGTSETKSYDAEGNLVSETDRLRRTTRYDYDRLDRRVKTVYPDGTSTRTEYDAAGRVVAEIDERGHRTEHEYDAAGRRVLTRDALDNETRFEYDPDGNLVRRIDANDNATGYTYNALDQKTVTTFADGTTVRQSHDALDRLTAKTDQAGRTTRYEYDAAGRLTKVIDAAGGETVYSYDEAGNKLTQTDANNHTTQWEYDAQGRVTARTLPGGQRETLVYDAAGNLVQKTDFNGRTTVHAYDLNDRRISTVYADGAEEQFTYDAAGNRTEVTRIDPQGNVRTTAFEYDRRDRLVREVKPGGDILEYDYDAAGNKTRLTKTVQTDTGPVTTTETYTYDKLNRLVEVQAEGQGEGITTYTYDAVGNRKTLTYPNGNVTEYTYDRLNRLTELTVTDGATTVLQQYTYTLDLTGRRTTIEEANGRITDYDYDKRYRLTGETVTDPVNGAHSASYSYDAAGNRTGSTVNGVTTAYTYDVNDRLMQQGGTTYTYDANGNTLSETEGGQTTTYSYDARNKLVSVDDGVDTVEYAYNSDGIRTEKTENGVTTRYLVDRNRDYSQVLAEVTDNALEAEYLYGDDLLAQDRSGNVSYYQYDGLGSTRALSDAAGSLTDTYHYDAFGIELASTGSTENAYRFTGEQLDSSLNQYYLRARFYNQQVGRFTQMDTFQGIQNDPVTLHKYLYANADPVNVIDPSGRFGGSINSFNAAMTGLGILAAAAVTAPQVGQSLLGSSIDGSLTDKDVGLLTIVGMSPVTGLKLLSLISAKDMSDSRADDKQSKERFYHGTTSNAANKIIAQGKGFRDIPTFFAEDISTARHFASERAAKTNASSTTVIELLIPESIIASSGMRRKEIGGDLGLQFVDLPGSTGYEWIIATHGGLQVLNGAITTGIVEVKRLRQ